MRSKENRSKGEKGEEIASQFLEKNGYLILALNYLRPLGEIDIVTRAPEDTLVFIEVKTMIDHGIHNLIPEDQMTNAKIERFRRICRFFVQKNPSLLKEEKGWRMDVVAITLPEGSHEEKLTYKSKDVKIIHYENI